MTTRNTSRAVKTDESEPSTSITTFIILTDCRRRRGSLIDRIDQTTHRDDS